MFLGERGGDCDSGFYINKIIKSALDKSTREKYSEIIQTAEMPCDLSDLKTE